MALSLSRNAKFYASYVAAGTSTWDGAGTHPGNADTFEIPILDGFSFSQATGTQNVTLNEAGTTPKRGQKMFNTSLEPVDWSFTTYMRPFKDTSDTNKHSMTEKLLWNALVSNTQTSNAGTGGITASTTNCTVTFEDSEHNQLLKFTGWFVFSDSSLAYELENMCVNSASIDFDIDGIAQITWSGFATSVTQVGTDYPDSVAHATDGHVAANMKDRWPGEGTGKGEVKGGKGKEKRALKGRKSSFFVQPGRERHCGQCNKRKKKRKRSAAPLTMCVGRYYETYAAHYE